MFRENDGHDKQNKMEIDTEIETSLNIRNKIYLEILKMEKVLKSRELEKITEVHKSCVASAKDEAQKHHVSIGLPKLEIPKFGRGSKEYRSFMECFD